ncbi:hypothetical protein ACIBKX_34670 [Streptomyces sp. NPDC050658]|uniref:hypothetical protein n=1 Tax=unclassified Streptomyces TaxID=2593676 RepID=UPI0034344F17
MGQARTGERTDGRPARWEGFEVGPLSLTPDEIRGVCRALLGLRPDEVPAAARRELRTGAGGEGPGILVYGAPPGKRTYDTALAAVGAGRRADDWSTIVETRSVCLAAPDDLLVGRTAPWRRAASGRPAVEIPVPEYYYLCHALLKLAAGPAEQALRILRPVIERLRAHPGCVVRVYALDLPLQIWLLWLRRAAGLERPLLVEANAPEVTADWGHKGVLHPDVRTAAQLPCPKGTARQTLDAESALTPFHRAFGAALPRLPGYTVTGADPAEFAARLALAARLLRERHGLARGCLKPTRGGAGQRIRTGIRLDDPHAAAALAREAADRREDYVLEAHAEYVRYAAAGHDFLHAPSAHVRAGGLAEGMALQFLDGTQWQGNVFLDRGTCGQLGISTAHYDAIRRAMDGFVTALAGRGLVNGGIDFALARVGGRHGDAVLAGMQDLNLSACGADFLRPFLEESRTVLGSGGPERLSAATKVIRPGPHLDLDRLRALVDHRTPGTYAKALSCVPGQWGLIAAAAPGPARAAADVLRIGRRVAQEAGAGG